jgi:preprotein translocase subunit SecG
MTPILAILFALVCMAIEALFSRSKNPAGAKRKKSEARRP